MRDRAPVRGKILHVVQGAHVVSDDPAVVLTAILGSCVAVCLRDPLARLGGMTHFLLPGQAGAGDGHALRVLLTTLLSRGAAKHRLEAKVFGGARMLGGLTDIGDWNAAFARRFLEGDGIPCLGTSTGGTRARRICFSPVTGRVRQLLVADRTPLGGSP